MSNLMEVVEPMARKLELLDEKISRLNHEVDELKSEREELNQQLVSIVQEQGIETSVGLPGGGTLKLYTSVYPSIKDFSAFEKWGKEKNVLLPQYTINPKTMQGWYQEAMENGEELPPQEIVTSFIKTKAKVLKRG